MYLTVLKHGDSATLDTMLKVRLQLARSMMTSSAVPFLFSTLIHAVQHFLISRCRSPVQLHKQADMQEEKNRIERVLGAISAPDLVQKVLNFALSVNIKEALFAPFPLLKSHQNLRCQAKTPAANPCPLLLPGRMRFVPRTRCQ